MLQVARIRTMSTTQVEALVGKPSLAGFTNSVRRFKSLRVSPYLVLRPMVSPFLTLATCTSLILHFSLDLPDLWHVDHCICTDYHTCVCLSLNLSICLLISPCRGGALAKNVFWVTAQDVSFGANSQFSGIILAQTSVTLKTGSSLHGRILAQTNVALQSATITTPL